MAYPACPDLNYSNRPVRTRMPGGVAGERPFRAAPYADRQPGVRKVFGKRKAMVEPVFSHMRTIQGLQRFRRRGLKAVACEFALHAMAYNLSRAVALLRAFYRYFSGVTGLYYRVFARTVGNLGRVWARTENLEELTA